MLETLESHAPALTAQRADAQELLGQAQALPTLPDIPARALAQLNEPDVALPEVGDIVALDPVLAARVVSLANSPVFAARGKIESISAAVVRVGARELRSLLLTVSLIDALECPSPRLRLREIWRHAIATGVIARRMARDLGESEPDRAYLAGLVHALGPVILAICFAERFERALAAGSEKDPLEVEFGVPATLCCALLLERWNMPAPVVEVVTFQRTPDQAPEHGRLARIVWSASCACRGFGLCPDPIGEPPGQDWRAEISRELLAEAYGGEPEGYLESLETVIDSLGEILAALLP